MSESIVISKDTIQEALREIVDEFMGEMREASSEKQDRRLHNIRRLLFRYPELRAHALNAVYEKGAYEESVEDILEELMMPGEFDVAVDSIKRSAARTEIIVSHIDAMLEIYRQSCASAADSDMQMRRYNILYDRFFADPQIKPDDLAEKYHITKRSVYKDINIAMEKLATLMFGVDGMKK